MRRKACGILAGLAFVLFTLLLGACTGDDPPLVEQPTPVPTPELLRAEDVPPYEGPTREVTGLFTEPRETEADVYRSVGPIPPSRFSEWDGGSVVLYEIATGTEIDLGVGSIHFTPFSPDGTKFAWVSGVLTLGSQTNDRLDEVNQVWVIDLETMEKKSYGDGWRVSFEDDSTLRVSAPPPSRAYRLIDLDIGELFASEESMADSSRWIVHYPYGYRLERIFESSDFPFGFRNLLVPDDGSIALQFESWLAVPLSADELLVGTALDGSGVNFFLVEIATGEATFLATASGGQSFFPQMAFIPAAPGGPPAYVAWSDYQCDAQQGSTWIYDLRSQTLTEIDRALPLGQGVGDKLALGYVSFRRAVLDLETLEYSDVMPGEIGPAWSGDERWAANGQSIFTLGGQYRYRCDETAD